jgi:serine/threonine-protein kinase
VQHDLSAWERLGPYLDKALELDPAERTTWLDALDASDADVARGIRALLSERDALNARGFLLGTPLPLTRVDTLLPALEEMLRHRIDIPQLAQSLAADSRQGGMTGGMLVGPYRLLREIGHGGMSFVWLAERCDGNLQREVALKLPFEGPAPARMAERFARERDILATLTHPNIARLYDAGVGASGHAYLAMEYVNGVPLTRYCDVMRLSVRDRLRIFLQVLVAVEFAHTHLVLHRDLKPSNILVTEHGRVVLLDFGIAKLLSRETSAESPLTELAGHVLTPDYASPEQISGDSLGTTSDVYSLGVVLYELLAGTRPFGDVYESRRALEEAILVQDPPKPSQRLITEELASARHTTPRKLAQTLRGDLDTVVLKALKKEPRERYQSIEAFARDLTSYLGDLPVSARPDSIWYRSRRFISRNRWQVGAGTIALLAIVIGGATARWQAKVATEQRDRAVLLASRNGAIVEFMTTLVADAASSEKPVTTREMLNRSETLALAGTRGDAGNRATILGTLAELNFVSGETEKPVQLLDQALLLADNAKDRDLHAHLACLHAAALSDMGRIETAIRTIERELASGKLDHHEISGCLHYRAIVAEKAGDAQGALKYATSALDELLQVPTRTLSDEAVAYSRLASAWRIVGDNSRANHFFEQALGKYLEAGREHSSATMVLMSNWANVSTAAGVPKRAVELYDRLLQVASERDPESPPPVAIVNNRGRALEDIGRYAEARDVAERGLQRARQTKNITIELSCLLSLASIAEQAGEIATARSYLADVDVAAGPSLSPDNPTWMRRALIRGLIDMHEGRLDTARTEFDAVVARKRKNPTVQRAALLRSELDLAAGDPPAALEDARLALDMALAAQGSLPYSSHTGLSWLMLGRALDAAGNREAARKAYETAVTHLSATVDANHPELVRAQQLLTAARV